MKKKLYIIAIALVAISCEKVIQIDYQDGDPKLVIDGEIHMSGENRVTLSMTQALDDPSATEYVSGAQVSITEPGGLVYTLSEGFTGQYSTPLGAQVSGLYQLKVIHNGDTNVATGYMPAQISIDSLIQFNQPGFFGSGMQRLVELNYQEPLNETNFYKLKVWNGANRIEDIYYWNDEFFNGEAVDFPLFAYNWDVNDTAVFQLISMDEDAYEYFKVLGDGQGGGGAFGTIPGNPVSNIQGNGIGVFGAYSSYLDTIVIQ